METKEEKSAKKTLRGTIVFLLTNIGSKSEMVKPYLYVNRDSQHLLLWESKEDRYYAQKILPFDGKFVDVTGEELRQVFVVENIVCVPFANEMQSKTDVSTSN